MITKDNKETKLATFDEPERELTASEVAFRTFFPEFSLKKQERKPPAVEIMTYSFNPNGVEELPPHGTYTVRYVSSFETYTEEAYNNLSSDRKLLAEEPVTKALAVEKNDVVLCKKALEDARDLVEREVISKQIDDTLEYIEEIVDSKVDTFEEIEADMAWSQSQCDIILPHYTSFLSAFTLGVSTFARKKNKIDLHKAREHLRGYCTVRPRHYLHYLSKVKGGNFSWNSIRSLYKDYFNTIADLNALHAIRRTHHQYGDEKSPYSFIDRLDKIVIPIWGFIMPHVYNESVSHPDWLRDDQLYAILYPVMNANASVDMRYTIGRPQNLTVPEAVRSILMSSSSLPELVDLSMYSPSTAKSYISSTSKHRVYIVPIFFKGTYIRFAAQVGDMKVATTFPVQYCSTLVAFPTRFGMAYASHVSDRVYFSTPDESRIYELDIPLKSSQVEVQHPESLAMMYVPRKPYCIIPFELVCKMFSGGKLLCSLPVLSLLNRTYYHLVNAHFGDIRNMAVLLGGRKELDCEESSSSDSSQEYGPREVLYGLV